MSGTVESVSEFTSTDTFAFSERGGNTSSSSISMKVTLEDTCSLHKGDEMVWYPITIITCFIFLMTPHYYQFLAGFLNSWFKIFIHTNVDFLPVNTLIYNRVNRLNMMDNDTAKGMNSPTAGIPAINTTTYPEIDGTFLTNIRHI